jgi:hypothetical protein
LFPALSISGAALFFFRGKVDGVEEKSDVNKKKTVQLAGGFIVLVTRMV